MATTSRHPDAGTPTSATTPMASAPVQATSIGTHLLLVVSGEADLFSAQAMRDDLRAALAVRPRSVAVDVSRLTYCDLAGLDALNDFCAEASVAGVPAVIHGMSPLLEWMHARFPASRRSPEPADRSAARPSLPSQPRAWSAERSRPTGTAPTSAAPPRPWPER